MTETMTQQEAAKQLSAKLLPCPFCGGSGCFKWLSNPGAPMPTGWVECGVCKAQIRFFCPPEKAVENWNRRAAFADAERKEK